ncbi:MAG: hypothetical protein U0W40_08160 [Acidimicrobiia bacterium]
MTSGTAARICRVRPDVPAIHRAFDYLVPAPLVGAVHVGAVVRVPLHGRRVRGWVVDADVAEPDAPRERLREILAVSSAGPPPDVLSLCDWAAWRWAGPVVTFLRAATPPNNVDPRGIVEPEVAVYPPSVIAGDGLFVTAPVAAAPIADLLAPEGSTIVLDPWAERAARTVDELEARGREVVLIGSDRSAAEVTAAWARARAGACVVVGGRNAVWAPVPDLAAVVVLDDVDEALEDERAPSWNARDVAVERAPSGQRRCRCRGAGRHAGTERRRGNCSATRSRRWRRGGRASPSSTRATRSRASGCSPACSPTRCGWCTTAGSDPCACSTGVAGRASSRNSCGDLARCERCGATVVQHDGDLVRPQCETTRPQVCLHCHGTKFKAVKPGVAKVRDDLAALLPRASVVAVDSGTDATSISDGGDLDADILIGTEAVLHRAGGGSRPIGLVAFLEFDQELLAPRARAAEQALWLLVRAARLVGPRADGGQLLVQTRLPEHEVVRAAAGSDPMLVTEEEANRRRVLGHPPFGGLAELAGDPAAVGAACDALRDLTVAATGVSLLGPVDGPGATRKALVRAATVAALCDALARAEVDAAHAIGRLRVDVDPRRI